MAKKSAKKANGSKKAETKASKKVALIHIGIMGSGRALCGAGGRTTTTVVVDDATCPECKRIANHAAAKARESAEGSAAASAREPATAPESGAAAGDGTGAAPKRQRGNVAATKDSTGPGERDPRLPPVGTVIKKLDRHGAVRCECKVVDGGFEYKGEHFKSLSGAACAAAKDLGVNGQQNGWLWWGLVKQDARAKNPVQVLEKAWDRYSARVKALAGAEMDAGAKKQVAELLEDHRTKIAEASGSFESAE